MRGGRARVVWAVAGLGVVFACAVSGTTVSSAKTATGSPPTVTGDARVDALLARMTTAEKLSMLSGSAEAATSARQYQAGYLAGVPRLGIPSLKLADGPPGVATRQASTGMTTTMGVAATFSWSDAQANGAVIGSDARALGQDVVLEPDLNLDRDTSWRRAYETFGEDPLLVSQMGAAEISGIQGAGEMAMAKHFLGYDGSNNVTIDDQTLHEVYLAPFASAVWAGVSSVMCSYNVINTVQACASPLLDGVLRGQLGFTGFVASDWGANHATSYLSNGLDLEMPGSGGPPGGGDPQYFSAAQLNAALKAGTVTIAQVNQAVGRILVAYDRFGLLTGKSKHTVTALPTAKDEPVVQHTAQDAATLLKNDDHTLPLSAADLGSLAVIGPGGGEVIATDNGDEKSSGLWSEQQSPLAALRAAEPKAKITYQVGDDLTGVPVYASMLSYHGKPGLLRTSGSSKTTDRSVNFTQADKHPLPAGRTESWTGDLTTSYAGTYQLAVQTLGAVTTLTVDGHALVTAGAGLNRPARYGVVHPGDGTTPVPTTDGLANGRAALALSKGAHRITITARPDASSRPVQVRFNLLTPARHTADVKAAVTAAHSAHTAIVFAWADGNDDLSHPLPDGQDALIAAVARANPNTIVVLNTGQPVALPWLSSVKSVLQMWYPGDRGGPATANVLLGRTDPDGRLPVTWPAAIGQEPAHQADHPDRNSWGINPTTGQPCPKPVGNDPTCHTTYSEGVDIGYRYYAATGETPLFPFGYGLNYSTVTYTNPQVTPTTSGLAATVAITDSGSTPVDATPQVYLGAPTNPAAGTQFAPTALAGFTRVHLTPGQTKTVTLTVARQRLQYWNTTTQAWATATGPRTVSINTDAATPVLTSTVNISG